MVYSPVQAAALRKHGLDLFHLRFEVAVHVRLLAHGLAGVQDGGVVPASDELADLGGGVVRAFFGDVHGDLAGLYDFPLA